MDHNGIYHPIPQTMAGVDIEIDSDEFQSWYISFSKYPPGAIFEGQHKISEILSKYFEESNRSKRQSRVTTMQLSNGGTVTLRLHL